MSRNSKSGENNNKPVRKQPVHAASGFAQAQWITITENDESQRIDNFLLKICKGVPKSHIYRILRSGEVRVNKGRIDPAYRLAAGDIVRIPPIQMAKRPETHIPHASFHILFEDDHLLIINKPASVAVHGGSGVSYGVIEQLRAARPDQKFLELAHRLDRETSGILVLAKKRSALVKFHEQMREGIVDKRYQALVHGQWQNPRQHIRLPLHKYLTPDGERRVRVQEGGMASHTVFNLIHQYGDFSLLEAELKTGRTHQIRVHLSASGYAIAGDDKYGNFELNKRLQKKHEHEGTLKRMFLHAHKLIFTHPATGGKMTISCPLPPECSAYLQSIRKNKKNDSKK